MTSTAERQLNHVLASYLRPTPDRNEKRKLLSQTQYLFQHLTNPLNITVLSQQFLKSPAIWDGPFDLALCLDVMSILNTACTKVVERYNEPSPTIPAIPTSLRTLSTKHWVEAVIKGADEKSPAWRHTLVFTGIVLSLQRNEERQNSYLVQDVQQYLVQAAEKAIHTLHTDTLTKAALMLAMSYTFERLPEHLKQSFSHNAWLQCGMETLTGDFGFEMGRFIAFAAVDVFVQAQPNGLVQLHWPENSPSYQNHVRQVATRPLVGNSGLFTKMLAYHIHHLLSPDTELPRLIDALQIFAKETANNWASTPFSNVDHHNTDASMDAQTKSTTYASFTTLLKRVYFALMVVLEACVSRLLNSYGLTLTPALAAKVLLTLRDIYFISLQVPGLQAFTFIHLTALDLLSASPAHVVDFYTAILPPRQPSSAIPLSPKERTNDLYALNTAEKFTLLLPPPQLTALLSIANPYITHAASLTPPPPGTSTQTLNELIEASYSALLAVLATPQMAEYTASTIGVHATNLLRSFPGALNSRQLRFGVRSLVTLCSPPSRVAELVPDAAVALLELVREVALHASAQPIPLTDEERAASENAVPISARGVYTLSLLDSLSVLTPAQLEVWLPLTAELVQRLEGVDKAEARKRFVEALESGEMDVDRSRVAVWWWTTGDGRRMLEGRHSNQNPEYLMSGGLGAGDGQSRL